MGTLNILKQVPRIAGVEIIPANLCEGTCWRVQVKPTSFASSPSRFGILPRCPCESARTACFDCNLASHKKMFTQKMFEKHLWYIWYSHSILVSILLDEHYRTMPPWKGKSLYTKSTIPKRLVHKVYQIMFGPGSLKNPKTWGNHTWSLQFDW